MIKEKNTNSPHLPMILIILDGWGIEKPNIGNAITLAKTPTLDGLLRKYPFVKLSAHGKYAGLPQHQVGNSEAGHMNIGAGRLVEQDSTIISRSIDEGTFFKNSAFMGAVRHMRKMNSRLHLMGMISDGQSPHSDPKHLLALLQLFRKNKIDNVFLHLFTDGRDSPKYSSINQIRDLERRLIGSEMVATIMGRFYAMDRKKKWERTEKAFESLVYGQGRRSDSAERAILEAYNRGDSDEFIEPHIIDNEKKVDSRIKDGDSIIFFNLRSDRSRQLAKAFVQHDFSKMNKGAFKRRGQFEHIYFVAMTDFGPDLDDILTAYPSVDIIDTLPVQLKHLKQLYIAETEKYAHVTYFFNGGYTGAIAGEDQVMVPSPDVKSYDITPAMSTEKLSQKIIANIKPNNVKKSWKYDFTVLNFAAPDMVGHTGNLKAAVKTCQYVDRCVGKIVKAYLSVSGTVLITADHGNIEKMINLETGEIYTAHTANQVPFIIINKKLRKNLRLRKSGTLGDIAPTILDILGQQKSRKMDRTSLIEK